MRNSSTPNGRFVALESVDRYARVRVEALALEVTVVDTVGSYFDTPGVGIVGVDSRDRRYLFASDDRSGGIRVSEWTGITYREILRGDGLERVGETLVIKDGASESVQREQRVALSGRTPTKARGEP
ncbi:hypothetical protein [Natronosalvus amylolyticus]|uniref:hypothetical protein n=1 Tax=Natronosalvus amylolyticus TaxID=2961994 RepID=UPI0020C97816|nr:hypothetical protein [Natronosalvus amylolyticus]